MKLRLDHPAFRRWAPLLVRGLIQLFFATTRFSLHGEPEGKALLVSPKPLIFAVWHCHILASLYFAEIFCRQRPPFVIMTSPSRDGDFIAHIGRGLGFLSCPGSRQKGGVKALKDMAVLARKGHPTGLAADGSRGPVHVVQKGVLYLARETQVPILPSAVAYSHKITLNTWDRFEIPLPFGQSAVLVEAPLLISPQDRGATLENKRLELEARLNRLFAQTRNFFSRG